ncbi:MAG: YgaP-like transmembrane domain [bacterium]
MVIDKNIGSVDRGIRMIAGIILPAVVSIKRRKKLWTK